MRTELRRHAAAWLLLAVFMPALVLSGLHIHAVAETVADTCTECVNHSHHHGHLTQAATCVSDCVVCQFLSLSYLEPVSLTLAVAVCLSVVLLAVYGATCTTRSGNTYAPRAPPCCFV